MKIEQIQQTVNKQMQLTSGQHPPAKKESKKQINSNQTYNQTNINQSTNKQIQQIQQTKDGNRTNATNSQQTNATNKFKNK